MHINCSICCELSGVTPNRLSPILKGAKNAILLESENFVVIPSIGPVVAGHCLVVTRHHASTLMQGLSPESFGELRHTLMILMSRLAINETEFPQLFCFEHGKKNADEHETLCSTAHAHLHVMPCANFDPGEVFKRLGVDHLSGMKQQSFMREIDSLEEYVAAFVWKGFNGEDSVAAAVNSVGFPSQYLRQVVGELSGLLEWDWKRFPRLDMVSDTIQRVSLGSRMDRNLVTEIGASSPR
jgi:diadenosine tetraphosphate (Ap4A) HIT family hydrolase